MLVPPLSLAIKDFIVEHIDYYEKRLGFSRLPVDKESFVHGHVKPEYDKDCIFMYQRI